MKFMEILRNKKWLVIGIAAVCALLILAACLLLIPGGDKPTGGSVTPGDTVTVTVENRAGTPLKNVQVYIYGDTALTDLVNFAKTDAEGKMSFVSEQPTHYAVLKGVAPGYKVEEYYPLDGANTTIVLDALAATADGKLPSDARFGVGDPMVDFTVTDVDGNSYTASEVLKEKKALVLNFWYTACQPCQMEFPYLQKAYDAYKEDLLLLAMDPHNTDTADSIKAFRTANNLTLPMVAADGVWATAMNIQAYPTTIIIDRFGMIVESHLGAITEEGVFEEMFAQYTNAEYNPNPEEDSNSTTDGNGGTTTTVPTGLQTEFSGVLGTKDEPIEIGGTLTFSTEIPAGKESHFNVYRVGGTVLTIKSGTVAVDYDGKTYTPKNGVVEIPVTTEDVTIPVQIVIRNTGKATEKYTVNFVYPKGTLANPIAVQMGDLTTEIAAGNDQGVVYTYTAPSNGIVEMTAVSATNGADYDFVLYNLNTYANRTLQADGNTKKVSIAMNKGDVLHITVGVLPNSENKYPASTIKSVLTFTPTEAGATKPTLPSTVTYTATVKDDAGAAMAGVALKFEVGTDAKTVTTDENGVASTVLTYGNGKVTITVPAGYVAAKLTYNLTPNAPSAAFVLEEDSWFDEPEEPTPPVDPEDPEEPIPPVDPEDPDTPVEPEPPVDTRVDYTVKLVDGSGAAQSGITVEIYTTTNELVEQAVTGADGVAVVKLEKGNYMIKISGTDRKYDERAAVMTASKTTVELMLAPLCDTTVFNTISDPLADGADKDAYYLNEGATYVELVPGERNYFVFEPVRSGTFRFTTSNTRAVPGSYGSPFYVLTNSSAEVENNAFTLSVHEVGPSYIIGVDAPTNISGAIVCITRVGDVDWNPNFEPWEDYVGTHVPTKFTLPAGITLQNVDITAATQEIVYNAADGYYHLNSVDGPVVYLRFNGSPYINLSDIVANQRVGAYLYDTNGEFIKKEQYNTYLQQYYYMPNPMYDPTGTPVNMLDKNMVYPLNADLVYILQAFAKHQQWDNPDAPNYLFKDANGEVIPGINNDLAWMFPLCYAE